MFQLAGFDIEVPWPDCAQPQHHVIVITGDCLPLVWPRLVTRGHCAGHAGTILLADED